MAQVMHTMHKVICRTLSVLAIAWCCVFPGWASLLQTGTDQHLNHAAAVFRGVVEQIGSFEEQGQIYTRALVRVEETIKGKLPGKVEIMHRGGQVQNKGESYCGFPVLKPGDDRLFFVSKNKTGKLFIESAEFGAPKSQSGKGESTLLRDLRSRKRGGALQGDNLAALAVTPDVWTNASVEYALSSTATNLVTGTDGLPARFIQPDSGQGVPYLVDADYLPAGITLTQAINAVTSALNAWTNISSVKFRFAGISSFGRSAPEVDETDGVLRIQMHDHYAHITGDSELGVGGNSWVIQNTPGGWTTGGNVAGNDFHAITRGFIVLKHSNPMLQNLATLTEVLAHEAGHAIGLGHSSQSDPEPVTLFKESIMYWLVHADGRGARLNAWDSNVCRQIHPPNTPPACYSRYLDVISGPTIPFPVPGVNTARVPTYDLQSVSPTLAMDSPTSGNGQFNLSGDIVSFQPASWYSDAPRYDPASGWTYDRAYVRSTDGLNFSPWALVSVVSLNSDSFDEGVPDWWRNTWFGGPNPSVGDKHKADDDFDSDGFDNITEWRMGSDPTSRNANLRMLSVSRTNLQFQAKPYEVYEVLRSTNLVNWTALPGAYVAKREIADVPLESGTGPGAFYRVRLIP